MGILCQVSLSILNYSDEFDVMIPLRPQHTKPNSADVNPPPPPLFCMMATAFTSLGTFSQNHVVNNSMHTPAPPRNSRFQVRRAYAWLYICASSSVSKHYRNKTLNGVRVRARVRRWLMKVCFSVWFIAGSVNSLNWEPFNCNSIPLPSNVF